MTGLIRVIPPIGVLSVGLRSRGWATAEAEPRRRRIAKRLTTDAANMFHASIVVFRHPLFHLWTMQPMVFALRQELKILRGVIELISVNVMHMLPRLQSASKFLFLDVPRKSRDASVALALTVPAFGLIDAGAAHSSRRNTSGVNGIKNRLLGAPEQRGNRSRGVRLVRLGQPSNVAERCRSFGVFRAAISHVRSVIHACARVNYYDEQIVLP